ncbi:MAG: hypothetical protein KGJ89_02360 [Patescibacteria group bacterium]|nr:hypothetical protein [Patescibacteria group bacterium]MDE2015720.1 hypothetical protein [Patescibacteria group bacterium]MDE2226778.1 hypothetical protein [Patescibacteria group bacterium]
MANYKEFIFKEVKGGLVEAIKIAIEKRADFINSGGSILDGSETLEAGYTIEEPNVFKPQEIVTKFFSQSSVRI